MDLAIDPQSRSVCEADGSGNGSMGPEHERIDARAIDPTLAGRPVT